ncbi:hypothetical protein [Comamonas sp.]|uniref:hypothetical protein n=1 Tax=Comamonas sp. TaxID=34028 RepID=UPI003A9339F3
MSDLKFLDLYQSSLAAVFQTIGNFSATIAPSPDSFMHRNVKTARIENGNSRTNDFFKDAIELMEEAIALAVSSRDKRTIRAKTDPA